MVADYPILSSNTFIYIRHGGWLPNMFI
jgi:hypothetical protein